MTIPTQMSLHGFIATDADLHFSENGVARFCARVGVPQVRQNADGSTNELEPTFHDLVIFRKTAERAYEAFRKGDTLVASGHINENPYERHGRTVAHEEFVAPAHRSQPCAHQVRRRAQAAGTAEPDLPITLPTEPVREPVVGL
jgi:single-strand DNA-binding protein